MSFFNVNNSEFGCLSVLSNDNNINRSDHHKIHYVEIKAFYKGKTSKCNVM